MKASKIIEELQNIIKEHGDLECLVFDNEEWLERANVYVMDISEFTPLAFCGLKDGDKAIQIST